MHQPTVVFQVPLKSAGTAYILWFFFGILGVHKFYLGRPMIGTLYLLTLGLLWVGVIYDLFTIPSQVKAANEKLMSESGAVFPTGSSTRSSSGESLGKQLSSLFAQPSSPEVDDGKSDAIISRYKGRMNSAPHMPSADTRPRATFGRRNA